MAIGNLHSEWQRLGLAVAIAGEAWDGILARLSAAYSAPGRHYHTLEHIDELLAHYAAFAPADPAAAGIDGAAFRLAIFFHDAVYDVRAKDNEEKSAELLDTELRSVGVAVPVIERGRRYVMATKHLGGGPRALEPDAAFFADLDLAILAAPPERYRRYARDIRREYAIYDDLTYAKGRAGALRTLAGGAAIFTTAGRMPGVPPPWEAAARANLTSELEALEQSSARPPS